MKSKYVTLGFISGWQIHWAIWRVILAVILLTVLGVLFINNASPVKDLTTSVIPNEIDRIIDKFFKAEGPCCNPPNIVPIVIAPELETETETENFVVEDKTQAGHNPEGIVEAGGLDLDIDWDNEGLISALLHEGKAYAILSESASGSKGRGDHYYLDMHSSASMSNASLQRLAEASIKSKLSDRCIRMQGKAAKHLKEKLYQQKKRRGAKLYLYLSVQWSQSLHELSNGQPARFKITLSGDKVVTTPL